MHNLLNFQESFLLDKRLNGANPKSRRCVVRAVASMKKKEEEKEEEDEEFPKLTKHIYHHARRRASFRGLFHV